MPIRRLDKLPKRKVTVDELILKSDVFDILDDLYSRRLNIEDNLAAVWTGDDGDIHFAYTGSKSKIMWLLENLKAELLKPEED